VRSQRPAVLRANALGDLVLTLPALQALRETFPAAELTLVSRSWQREFFRGRNGPVDRVEVVPDPSVL
jgi:ADP-heptose:LPS heptosyltransferase